MNDPRYAAATASPNPSNSPLPPPARGPLLLFLAIVLPQSCLVLLNLRAYYLMSGEMAPDQMHRAWLVFAFEVTLLVGGSALGWFLLRRGKPAPWPANLAVLAGNAAYLWLAVEWLGNGTIVPGAVEAWIAPSGQQIFHQFVFIMPAAFVSLLGLACIPAPWGRWTDIGLCLVVTAGVPFFWYCLMQIASGARLPEMLMIVLFAGSSLLCLTAFLRLVTRLFAWAACSGRRGQAVLAFLAGLAGPLGGLALNSRIPFPTDFQSPVIYALAILNGVLLLIPATGRVALDRTVWLGRCALWPFSAYFFLVFLPFLPLSVPAMIVAGAGFLILAPTALIIVHTRSILIPLRMEIREGWGLKAAALAVGAGCLLPGGIIGTALFDREALNSAINYVFNPDYRADSRFTGSLWAAQRSLERLRDQKCAVYMPFLTEFYDWAVFDGLTLSTGKMQTLHRAFFGKPLSQPAEKGFGLITNRRTMTGLKMPAPRPFPATVKLEGITTTSHTEGGCTLTNAELNLQNGSPILAEYTATIKLPPGVMVSGYWLHIGTERIPGQIIERKTALWIYQMIRDVTQRDPGVLSYTGPDTLELRVFPFNADEKRITEIEFLSPPGVSGEVEIGGQTVKIASDGGMATLAATAEGTQLTLPPAALDALPEMTRRPYLHFIVDRSAKSRFTPERAIEAMREAAKRFPNAGACEVTAANYDCRELGSDLTPLGELHQFAALPPGDWLPQRGSFLCDRAIKRALLEDQDRFQHAKPGSAWFESYPIIVVVGGNGDEVIADDDLSYFAGLAPDIDHYYRTDGTSLQAVRFGGTAAQRASAEPRAVHVLRLGGSLAVLPAAGSQPATLGFPSEAQGEVEVFNPASQAFEPVAAVQRLDHANRYTQGAEARLASLAAIENPSITTRPDGLRRIVHLSRRSGVLVPATSYIVVENAAQARMMNLKEQQKLGSSQALDFMDTPEPSVAVTALVALAILLLGRRGFLREREAGRSCGGQKLPGL